MAPIFVLPVLIVPREGPKNTNNERKEINRKGHKEHIGREARKDAKSEQFEFRNFFL